MFYGNYDMMNMMNMNTGYGNFGNPFMSMMGGYGMSSYSFGGGYMMPSVFNYGGYGMFGGGYGMYGCGCGMPDDSTMDAMAGFAVVTGLLGVGAAAYGSHVRNKAENSTENKLAQNKQQLQNLLDKLDKNASANDYKNYINNAETEMNNAKTVLDSFDANTIANADNVINSYSVNRADLLTKINQEQDPTRKEELRQQLNQLEQDKKDAETLKKEYKNAQIAYTNAKNKYDNFNAIGEQIDKLVAEQESLNAQIKREADAKTLDQADGTIFTRTTEKSFTKMYDFNLGTFGTKKDGAAYTAADLSTSDIRYIINKYKQGNLIEKRQVKAFLKNNINNIREEALKGSNKAGVDLILKAELG